jgi:hypothetical protein
MDFETSLDGLVQGSPVRFRGITVGSVSRIAMRYADDGRTIQTPVYVQITEGQVEGGGRERGRSKAEDGTSTTRTSGSRLGSSGGFGRSSSPSAS